MRVLKPIRLILLLASLTVASGICAQDNYYVSSSQANIRQEPSTSNDVILTLSKHDNLKRIDVDSTTTEWYKVTLDNGSNGYVHKSLVKPGRAVVSKIQYRTGAICRDGTRSSATGRGACSHHGGVARWTHGTRTSVQIE